MEWKGTKRYCWCVCGTLLWDRFENSNGHSRRPRNGWQKEGKGMRVWVSKWVSERVREWKSEGKKVRRKYEMWMHDEKNICFSYMFLLVRLASQLAKLEDTSVDQLTSYFWLSYYTHHWNIEFLSNEQLLSYFPIVCEQFSRVEFRSSQFRSVQFFIHQNIEFIIYITFFTHSYLIYLVKGSVSK